MKNKAFSMSIRKKAVQRKQKRSFREKQVPKLIQDIALGKFVTLNACNMVWHSLAADLPSCNRVRVEYLVTFTRHLWQAGMQLFLMP